MVIKFENRCTFGVFWLQRILEVKRVWTNFKAELSAFVEHTLAQKYNGATPPQLALVSPIAFQNLSDKYDLPNGINENKNLELYTNAIQEVAKNTMSSF